MPRSYAAGMGGAETTQRQKGMQMIRVMKSVALVVVGLLLAGNVTSRAGDKQPTSPQDFLAKAIDCSVTEKDLAEKAVKNAQSADVRQYAQKLVNDHDKMNKDAMDLAKNLKIGVVTGTSKEHKEVLAKLMTATGKDFDQKFVHHMVEGHEKAIKMFEHCSKNATNEQLRNFASQALPTLRDHLERARKLDKMLNNR